MLTKLAERGVEVNVSRKVLSNGQHFPCSPLSQDGTTALFMAAQNGLAPIVALLLQLKADTNLAKSVISSSFNFGTILYAFICSRVPFLQDGGTPLFIAVENGHLECMHMLLAAKSDINHKKMVFMFVSRLFAI